MALNRAWILRHLREGEHSQAQQQSDIAWEDLERSIMDFIPMRNALASQAWGIAESLCSGALAPAFRVDQKSDDALALDMLRDGQAHSSFDPSRAPDPVELVLLWYHFEQWTDINDSLMHTWNIQGTSVAWVDDQQSAIAKNYAEKGCALASAEPGRYGTVYRIRFRYMRRDALITVRAVDIYEDVRQRCSRTAGRAEHLDALQESHAFLLAKARDIAAKIAQAPAPGQAGRDLDPELTQPASIPYRDGASQKSASPEVRVSVHEKGGGDDESLSSATSRISPEGMEATAPLTSSAGERAKASPPNAIRTGIRGEILINTSKNAKVDNAGLDATLPFRGGPGKKQPNAPDRRHAKDGDA
jgi:hypothetical protein